jgi:hypothetical protein
MAMDCCSVRHPGDDRLLTRTLGAAVRLPSGAVPFLAASALLKASKLG